MSIFNELTEATARVLAASGPAVVRVGRAEGRGAGIVVGPGAVLTSAHNLRGEESTVTFADGRTVTATVKGVDADGDLAVLAAETLDVPPIEWAGTDQVEPGAAVFALALPAGGGGARITFGTVSAVGRTFRGPRGRLITDGIEHTALLGRGSSGGPLVDVEGRLLAINTHRPGDGFYLALPATPSLQSRVDALARGEAPVRRRLGVALAAPHQARRLRAAVGLPARDGVLVRDVADDSPASTGGLLRGDLVVAAGGRSIGSIDDLLAAVDGVGDDGVLSLQVVRGTDELDLTVRFTAAPPQ
jgi:serine protease Do